MSSSAAAASRPPKPSSWGSRDMAMKVLVAEQIADSGIALLRREFEVDVVTGLRAEQLVEKITGYDALMLAQARNIPQANTSMHAGKWERSKFTGTEVYDKTLGIVGLGRIGTLVAERAKGLGMKLIGYDPYITPDRAAHLGVEMYATVDELLPHADFLTVHLPKTKETIGMFGAAQFAKMRDGVRLVNTARGGIYQVEALAEAIKSGKVASAGIDVFEVEP